MDENEISRRFDSGLPVPAWLGVPDLPIGDVGHPVTDARLLLAILRADRAAARLLRAFGLDESAVRALVQDETDRM